MCSGLAQLTCDDSTALLSSSGGRRGQISTDMATAWSTPGRVLAGYRLAQASMILGCECGCRSGRSQASGQLKLSAVRARQQQAAGWEKGGVRAPRSFGHTPGCSIAQKSSLTYTYLPASNGSPDGNTLRATHRMVAVNRARTVHRPARLLSLRVGSDDDATWRRTSRSRWSCRSCLQAPTSRTKCQRCQGGLCLSYHLDARPLFGL